MKPLKESLSDTEKVEVLYGWRSLFKTACGMNPDAAWQLVCLQLMGNRQGIEMSEIATMFPPKGGFQVGE